MLKFNPEVLRTLLTTLYPKKQQQLSIEISIRLLLGQVTGPPAHSYLPYIQLAEFSLGAQRQRQNAALREFYTMKPNKRLTTEGRLTIVSSHPQLLGLAHLVQLFLDIKFYNFGFGSQWISFHGILSRLRNIHRDIPGGKYAPNELYSILLTFLDVDLTIEGSILTECTARMNQIIGYSR